VPGQAAGLIRRLVLIDTSVWVEALSPTGDAACRQRVQELTDQGRAATCAIVIAEVLRGAVNESDAAALDTRLRALRVLPCDGAGTVAAYIGRLMSAPRQRLADLLIAGVARVHNTFLLHRDHHLARIAARCSIPEVSL